MCQSVKTFKKMAVQKRMTCRIRHGIGYDHTLTSKRLLKIAMKHEHVVHFKTF